MTPTVEVLVLDLLEWLAAKERSYEETMDAWRTSFPRLPVWPAGPGGMPTISDWLRLSERTDGNSCA